MGQGIVLIADDQSASIRQLSDALEAINAGYAIASTTADAWDFVFTQQDISTVLLRGQSDNIDGPSLCRQIRLLKSKDELTVIALQRDREFGCGAEMLLAGCNDLLVEPYQASELYLRARMNVPEKARRTDASHAPQQESAGRSQMIVPEFDPISRRVTFGVQEGQQKTWNNHRSMKRVPLDRIILCPECEGVATFRPGCGACGSAWVEEEVLIHHYACAHVGPEREFVHENGMVCPKCRLTDLVAGADFETTKGCFRCSDCSAVSSEPQMIGHCLACDHRFAAANGILRDIYGYQLLDHPAPAAVNRPAFLTAESRQSTSC